MALKLRNRSWLKDYLAKQARQIEAALIYFLEFTVEELINHAKSHAGYQDQTSNLKSSIGGGVVKNGKLVSYKGFVNEGSADKGAQTGLEFLNGLLGEVGTGYGIIVCAGMEYATYVENNYGLNVLKASELLMPDKLKKMIDDLKATMKQR